METQRGRLENHQYLRGLILLYVSFCITSGWAQDRFSLFSCLSIERPENYNPRPCKPATQAQIKYMQDGFQKKDAFLKQCGENTQNSDLCSQVISSNPDSRKTFACTYPAPHNFTFVHPDESTWDFAFETIRILDRLRQEGVQMCRIYNWWRPEPYNRNVGGDSRRHPYGTAVDVQFSSLEDQQTAFSSLCALKESGVINALGFYNASPSIHIGIADAPDIKTLWGRSRCR